MTDNTASAITFRLAAVLGANTRGLGDLLRDGIDPAALLSADPHTLGQLPSSTAARLAASSGAKGSVRAADVLRRRLQACAAQFVSINVSAYPQLLRDIPDPPPWLFCRGDAEQLRKPMVAVVGSRRASHAGLKLADTLGSLLAGAGYGVCSGMALGIDGAAHRGALRNGSSVAVLGTGIDGCYPRQHADLSAQLLDAGCLVSEFPPGTSVHKGQFPRRNRIISGLSRATIIVEAALPSGSLHTAAAALEQGREVFVMPWSVLHKGGAGCLYLLRDGATPITSLDDLHGHFPVLEASAPPPTGADASLLDIIGDGSLSLSVLQRASGLPLSDLLAMLGRLEVEGRVKRSDGCYILS